MCRTTIAITVARRRERGFTLIMVLAVMMIIALMVIAGSQFSNTEIRMSANDSDRKFAISLAEQALREGENQAGVINAKLPPLLRQDGSNKAQIDGYVNFIPNYPAIFTQMLEGGANPAGFVQSFKNDCTNGLCAPSVNVDNIQYGGLDKKNIPAWERPNVFDGTQENSRVAVGVNQGGASQPPRYIIEFLGRQKNGLSNYRVTARAWGQNPNTRVTLQSYIEIESRR